MPGPRHLQALAHFLLEPLRVGDFEYDIGDFLTEFATQFLPRGLGVFQRIVQQRCGNDQRVAHSPSSHSTWASSIGG